MRLAAPHRAAKPVHALVGDDGLHRGGLAHDAAGRADAVLLEVADQSAHADAAHFLVVAQRIMERRIEPPGIERFEELSAPALSATPMNPFMSAEPRA